MRCRPLFFVYGSLFTRAYEHIIHTHGSLKAWTRISSKKITQRHIHLALKNWRFRDSGSRRIFSECLYEFITCSSCECVCILNDSSMVTLNFSAAQCCSSNNPYRGSYYEIRLKHSTNWTRISHQWKNASLQNIW